MNHLVTNPWNEDQTPRSEETASQLLRNGGKMKVEDDQENTVKQLR
jgi:hypothetical protein